MDKGDKVFRLKAPPENMRDIPGTPRWLRHFIFALLWVLAATPAMTDGQGNLALLGLPAVPDHGGKDTQALVRLGARLFFDKNLSIDGTISCASCHVPEKAFADGKTVAMGVSGQRGERNTPSLINVALQNSFFWDGRRESLVAQAGDPFINPREHGLPSHDELMSLLLTNPVYRQDFRDAFGRGEIVLDQVLMALAAFQRTLLAGASAFDRFRYGGDEKALSLAAQRGLALFTGRAGCATCHLVGNREARFSDDAFHSIGVGQGQLAENLPHLIRRTFASTRLAPSRLLENAPELASLGRFVVTLDPKDVGAFRTPSLRNVALTAPYMHDGSISGLADAIDREVYYRGQQDGHALILTPDERADLLSFLEALTSSGLENLAELARKTAKQPDERQ